MLDRNRLRTTHGRESQSRIKPRRVAAAENAARWREAFVRYLRSECHLAENTVLAYDRDLRRFFDWLRGRRIEGLTISDLSDYPAWLTAQELAPASISRHVVSLKVFFRYLQLEGVLTDNQAELLGTQKLWQRVPTVLSPTEIDALLAAPRPPQPWWRRDRAMLELLYATGCRVSELSMLRPRDVHLGRAVLPVPRQGRQAARRAARAARRWRRVEAYLRTRAAEAGRTAADAVGVSAALVARRPAAPRADLGADQTVREASRLRGRAEPALAAAQLRDAPAGRRGRPAAGAGNARPRQHRHDADLHARRSLAAEEGPRDVSSAGLAASALA